MFEHYEKVIAVVLVVLCALVGIIGYSFSKPTVQPKKVWLEAPAGDVIFDHHYHTEFADCETCHHDYTEDQASDAEMGCRSCHYYGEASESESDDSTHKHFIGAQCVDCHKSYEMSVACDTCHSPSGTAARRSGLQMPSLPEEVTFRADAGTVLFDHRLHISEDVGEPCLTCHHPIEGKEWAGKGDHGKNCRACHYDLAAKIPENEDEYHKRYIGANCTECHDADDCDMCHGG
jgi:hypothetical protein